MSQQLVARIRKTSKYAEQGPNGGWFDVEIDNVRGSYEVLGNRNYYRRSDVTFGVRRPDGTIYELSN